MHHRELGYRPGLDGVRGLAILLVLLSHGPHLAGGHHGVTVFFTLSGFLITTLLLDEHALRGRAELKTFYGRRVARLMPGLVVATTCYAAVFSVSALIGHGRENVALGALAALTYTSNIVSVVHGEQVLTSFAWTWSLSIEEQFYLLWPPLLFGLLRRRRGVTLACLTALALSAAAIAERFLLARVDADPLHTRVYMGTDTRADNLLLGCALALVLHRTSGRIVAARWVGLVGLAAVLVPSAVLSRTAVASYTWGMVAVELGAAALIVTVLRAPEAAVSKLLRAKPLVHVGKLAYGLYLWNVLVLWTLAYYVGPLPSGLHSLLFFAGSLALAEISARYVERPCVRWWRARQAGPRQSREVGRVG